MELKPCPFCGSPAIVSEVFIGEKHTRHEDSVPYDAKITRVFEKKCHTLYFYKPLNYVPQCSVSSCVGRTRKSFSVKEDAINAWNQRP